MGSIKKELRMQGAELVCLLMILSITNSKMVNHSNVNTEERIFEVNSNGHRFKLQAPTSYSIEDLLMTLAVLLILLIMILIWYSLARAVIYLAYHTEDRRIAFQKNYEEESLYEESLIKQGVKL